MVSGFDIEIALFSFATAAFAFTLVSVLLVVSWGRGPLGAWLIAACAATAAWALISGGELFWSSRPTVITSVAETLRTGSWLAFLVMLLHFQKGAHRQSTFRQWPMRAVLAAVVVVVGIDLLGSISALSAQWILIPDLDLISRLMFAVAGMALIENLYRNADADQRWNLKFMCLGVGGIFAFDFFLFAHALLFKQINFDLIVARGFTNALVAPLIAVAAARNPDWSVDIFISRKVVFHSTSLMGSGIYLLAMAAAGFYLKEYGGSWGALFQIIFLFGSVLVLMIVLFSGRFRARIKIFLSKHFYNYQYDYREEWLRFINTISDAGSRLDLRTRAIRACADIVESPGGSLWLPDENGDFTVAARLNTDAHERLGGAVSATLMDFLKTTGWVVDLDEYFSHPESYPGLRLASVWREGPDLWLIMPLIHHGEVTGFILLDHPRARRSLNWENFDLLKTVGRQIASYLSEQETEQALAEARQFKEFNQRFAFILHDLKNLVSQLSLLIKNADKHSANPEFQRDMIATVRESVDKMKGLLTRLHQNPEDGPQRAAINMHGLLKEIVSQNAESAEKLTMTAKSGDVWVRGDRDRFAMLFGHLIQNAVEATPKDGTVAVILAVEDGRAVVDIQDGGAGMSKEFIRDVLFKPFHSTKPSGYGIGAYESREIARQFGGSLEVRSDKGQGTIMRVIFPRLSDHPTRRAK